MFPDGVGRPSSQAAGEQSRLIGQVMELLEKTYGEAFDPDSVNAARFAVHLRYFLVRARTAVQIEDGTASQVAQALRSSAPDSYRVALRIRDLMEIRLGVAVTEDETAYLALHIAPNVAPIAWANLFVNTAFALVSLSGLSYLGFGVSAQAADWGRQLADARTFLSLNPAAALAPGTAIIVVAAAFNTRVIT